MKCSECKFWLGGSAEIDAGELPGECHRRAPRPYLIPTVGIPFGYGNASWPATYRGDFCGEFVAKAEKRAGFV
jgi:hypothetical protein